MSIGEWADPGRVVKWRRGEAEDAGCPCCGEFDYFEEHVGGYDRARESGVLLRVIEYRCSRSGRAWTDTEVYRYAGSVLEG